MATATDKELWLAARAIEYLKPEGTASLIAEKTTQAQWNTIIDWLEAKRREVKNARLQAQISMLQGEIET